MYHRLLPCGCGWSQTLEKPYRLCGLNLCREHAHLMSDRSKSLLAHLWQLDADLAERSRNGSQPATEG